MTTLGTPHIPNRAGEETPLTELGLLIFNQRMDRNQLADKILELDIRNLEGEIATIIGIMVKNKNSGSGFTVTGHIGVNTVLNAALLIKNNPIFRGCESKILAQVIGKDFNQECVISDVIEIEEALGVTKPNSGFDIIKAVYQQAQKIASARFEIALESVESQGKVSKIYNSGKK